MQAQQISFSAACRHNVKTKPATRSNRFAIGYSSPPKTRPSRLGALPKTNTLIAEDTLIAPIYSPSFTRSNSTHNNSLLEGTYYLPLITGSSFIATTYKAITSSAAHSASIAFMSGIAFLAATGFAIRRHYLVKNLNRRDLNEQNMRSQRFFDAIAKPSHK